jgi:homocysteine S-methyltransferase
MEWKMGDREDPPQLRGETPFLTDGGLETDLIFNRGIDLPCFAAFDLLKDDGGRQTLRGYFEPFLEVAAEHRSGFVLDTATWRASPDWGERLGYSPDGLRQANQAWRRRSAAPRHAKQARLCSKEWWGRGGTAMSRVR